MVFFRTLGAVIGEHKRFLTICLLLFLLEVFAIIYISYDYDLLAIQADLSALIQHPKVNNLSVVFISILVEAAPFILIGTFVSAIIQVFVSEQLIAKVLPKNKIVGLIGASLMGFVFPVCECAIVPIMRRLLKKGVPFYISITFMLAVPIVNPVVLASTYYAFSGDMKIVLLRAFLGMFGAITIGSIIDRIQVDKDIFKETAIDGDGCCSMERDQDENPSFIVKVGRVIEFASVELYDVGRFLIAGAFLSSVMDVFMPKDMLISIGQGNVSSILVLMLMTFVLSLCSETDAFIGRTFVGQFTSGSIIGFLIFGPMIDIKNTIMLSGSFKAKFVWKLIAVITIVCFTIAFVMNLISI